jgi:hypothetical protein
MFGWIFKMFPLKGFKQRQDGIVAFHMHHIFQKKEENGLKWE